MKKLLIISIMAIFGCKTVYPPLQTVDYVDLEKYAGLWYEIALIPNSFEKGCSCTTAEYQITGKSYIRVINSCQRKGKRTYAKGKAFVVKGSNNARLKVQFFWPFRGDYYIIGLAEDYSWALVGNPSREYLWILAREKKMDYDTYEKIRELANLKGFNTNDLIKITHECK